MSFTLEYLIETRKILEALDYDAIEDLAQGLATVRERGGRLFILGVGGSAAHASHAVNDFRKICNFEAYTPTDNVAELTARINDVGWYSCFKDWLVVSRLKRKDGLLIFSVGGGSQDVSENICHALWYAAEKKAFIGGIVGRDGGETAALRRSKVVIIPPLVGERITPHTEGICAVIWHLLVSHPALQK